MKKEIKKKLSLNRESLVKLQTQNLQQVGGGQGSGNWCGSDCNTECTCPTL